MPGFDYQIYDDGTRNMWFKSYKVYMKILRKYCEAFLNETPCWMWVGVPAVLEWRSNDISDTGKQYKAEPATCTLRYIQKF